MAFPCWSTRISEPPSAIQPLPIPIHRLPTTIQRLPIPIHRLPTTIQRLPIAIPRLPTPISRLPIAIPRPPTPVSWPRILIGRCRIQIQPLRITISRGKIRITRSEVLVLLRICSPRLVCCARGHRDRPARDTALPQTASESLPLPQITTLPSAPADVVCRLG